jgi:hypothetical protein
MRPPITSLGTAMPSVAADTVSNERFAAVRRVRVFVPAGLTGTWISSSSVRSRARRILWGSPL